MSFANRKLSLVMIAVLLAGVVLVALELSKTHLFHKAPIVSGPTKSASPKPSPSLTSQKNPSTPTSTVNQGSDNDQNGQLPSNVSGNSGQWSTSQSGLITVKTPLQNGGFKSGDPLAGSASVDKVQYRLVDDRYGVISQGFINVVDGNFSADVNFSSHSSSGRLDVFNTDPNGKEINEVQVYVAFQ